MLKKRKDKEIVSIVFKSQNILRKKTSRKKLILILGLKILTKRNSKNIITTKDVLKKCLHTLYGEMSGKESQIMLTSKKCVFFFNREKKFKNVVEECLEKKV